MKLSAGGVSSRAVLPPFLASVACLLSGCGSHEAPLRVAGPQCLPLTGAMPAQLNGIAPADGLTLIVAEPRGISITASLDGRRTRSPVDRYGVVTFVRHSRSGEQLTLSVETRDSPQIFGEVCVSMAQLPAADAASIRAEQYFAAAGQSVEADQSQRAFDEYLEAAREFDSFDSLRAAQARHAMAELAYKLTREDDAYWLARAALTGFGSNASPGLRSALLSLQARTLLESERFDAGERRARVSNLLAESRRAAAKDRFGAREMPRLDVLRGFMDYRAGNTSRAAAWFAQAAAQCEALKDWECYARALQNSASLAIEARDFTVALKAYSDTLRVLPPYLDRQLAADIWGNQGRLQGTAGLFEASERSSRVSIRLHADIDDCEGARVGIARLGELLVQVGSVAESVSALTQATSLECPQLLAVAKHEIEDAATPAGNICAQPLKADSLGPSGKLAVFTALLGLHEALRLERRTVEARRCLASAAAYASTARTRLRFANAEGSALLEEQKPERASAAFEQALMSADRDGIPQSYDHRSEAYLGLARAALMAGQRAAAREYANRSLLLSSARADVGQVVDSLELMARSFSGTTDSEQAIAILHAATGLVEQVPIGGLDAAKRATWLATQHAVFSELTTLFATSTNADDAHAWLAFEASERGRARSLRYAMNRAADSVSGGARDEPTTASYQELMQRIARLAQPVRAGAASQIPLGALEEMGRGVDTDDPSSSRNLLQQRLAMLDATAVEYAAGRDDMYAFVIDGEHISVTRLGGRQEIAAAAAGLYEKARNPENAYGDVQRAAAKLAQLVLWPISAKLTHRRVIVVPDDSLHTVPFAILPWASGEDAPLVLERAELSVMPSTLFVTHPRSTPAPRAGSPRLELIGDPVFQHAEWQRECAGVQPTPAGPAATQTAASERRPLPRLPGSRKEVLAIAQLAQRASPSIRVSTRLGCDATPAALRAAAATSPELLHIATHGYVDAYRPRLSALALTQDSAANGGMATIGLLDILDMRVSSRLVVLSACDTSRGRLLPGEGVLGPAQAFLQAGAASVIASYWRIPDEHTAPFMETFYRYLLVDRLSAAAALRRTQLDYARDRASYDWAAFTLYGWPDTAL
jgi:CHAT domain-containing protein